MQDSLLVTCPKCKSKFRDNARRIQSGYSRQCPSCEAVIFFEEGNPPVHVRRALREPHDLRKVLIQQEQETTPARVDGRELSVADQSDAREAGRLTNFRAFGYAGRSEGGIGNLTTSHARKRSLRMYTCAERSGLRFGRKFVWWSFQKSANFDVIPLIE